MQIQKTITLTSMLGLTLLSIIPGSAFPAMLFERFIPFIPSWDVLLTEGSWYHQAKNYYTEFIRADSQYWGKLLFFIILAFSLKSVYNILKDYLYGKKA